MSRFPVLPCEQLYIAAVEVIRSRIQLYSDMASVYRWTSWILLVKNPQKMYLKVIAYRWSRPSLLLSVGVYPLAPPKGPESGGIAALIQHCSFFSLFVGGAVLGKCVTHLSHNLGTQRFLSEGIT